MTDDLTSPRIIKELLQKYGAAPSKTMGQNFLIDKNILQKILEAADIQPDETIVEIGPGIGILTQALAARAKKVITIEKDRAMVEILQETLKDAGNVQVLHGDILETDIKLPKKYKVVANVPYYITSPIIRMFLEGKNPPQLMVLMVQKEVAQRICQKPPEMSLLSVSVQYYAVPKIIWTVSRGCFWPSPNVDSAIIAITPQKQIGKTDPDAFFRIVKAGFSHPRKQLLNNLSTTLKKERQETETWLLENNLNPLQRAETLTVQDWENLTNTVS